MNRAGNRMVRVRRNALFLLRMHYHLKVMRGGYLAGAAAVPALSAVLAMRAGSFGLAVPAPDLQKAVMVLAMPLFAALVFPLFAAEELEERVMRLLYACPIPAAVIMLEKIAVCLMLLAAGIGLSAAVANGDGWWPLMRAALPASLFIGSVSAAASLIGRHMLVGLGTGVGYWIVELITRGRWTGPLHLFHPIWPKEGMDGGANALALSSAAGTLFCFTIMMVVWGKRWLARI